MSLMGIVEAQLARQAVTYDRVLGRSASWGISCKDNKDLTKLDAPITNYEEWATSIRDQLSRTNRGWSILLSFVEKQPTITTTRCCRRCMWVE